MSSTDQASFAALFQAGWFVESLWTQTMVIHMLRTPGIPLLHSRAAWQVTLLTGLGVAVGTAIPFTALGQGLDMGALPASYFPWLAAVLAGYLTLATLVKGAFMRRYNTWL